MLYQSANRDKAVVDDADRFRKALTEAVTFDQTHPGAERLVAFPASLSAAGLAEANPILLGR